MSLTAIIGSHGINATYGGFDQLVNNLVEKASEDKSYIVFNSIETPINASKIPDNCRVIRLPLSASGFQGLIYDYLSILIAIFMCKRFLLLGMQGIPFAVLLRMLTFGKLKIVVNTGGIEWMRPHLSFLSKSYFKICFYFSCHFANTAIIDNAHYLDYLPKRKKNRDRLRIIPYGGFIDESIKYPDNHLLDKYPFLNNEYYLSISRSIEDNNILEICNYFKNNNSINLVLISNLSNSVYGKMIKNKFKDTANINLIDGLYLKPELDLIRRNCKAYIHTHTLCGSAPSLIEMIVAQRPIFSINIPQNKFTLDGNGYFFDEFTDLDSPISNNNIDIFIPPISHANKFEWSHIVKQYEDCFK